MGIHPWPVATPHKGPVTRKMFPFDDVIMMRHLIRSWNGAQVGLPINSQWFYLKFSLTTLRWRHNELDGVSDHQPHDCLLNRSFRRISKKTWKLRFTGLCEGNSPGPVNSPHKRPVMRKMFPFDDVIMKVYGWVVPGMAGDFPCHLVDMLSSVSISDLGYTDELMDQLNDYGVLRWVFVVCRNLYPVSSKSFRASLSNMIAADALAPYVAIPEPYWLCKVYVWCFVG